MFQVQSVGLNDALDRNPYLLFYELTESPPDLCSSEQLLQVTAGQPDYSTQWGKYYPSMGNSTQCAEYYRFMGNSTQLVEYYPSMGNSTQWAEYYHSMGMIREPETIDQRSMGMIREAETFEQQAKFIKPAAAPDPAAIAPAQPQAPQEPGSDFSQQWIDYYRAQGQHTEADEIEAQVKAQKQQVVGPSPDTNVATAQELSQQWIQHSQSQGMHAGADKLDAQIKAQVKDQIKAHIKAQKKAKKKALVEAQKQQVADPSPATNDATSQELSQQSIQHYQSQGMHAEADQLDAQIKTQKKAQKKAEGKACRRRQAALAALFPTSQAAAYQ